MKERFKKLCASLLVAAMVFTYMPVLGLGAVDVYAAEKLASMPKCDLGSFEYTGEVPDLDSALPTITLTDDTVLYVNKDYKLEPIGDGYTVGDQKVKVTFIGNYSEYEADVDSVTYKVTEESSNYTYTADIQEAKLVYKNAALTEADIKAVTKFVRSDNKVIADADYAIVLEGSGVDAGSEYKANFQVGGKTVLTKTVKIQKLDLAAAELKADVAAAEYTSKALEPAVSNVMAGTIAVPAADYTVAYSNNVNAGEKAVATITAKSTSKNFAGAGSVNFKISPKAMTDASVNAVVTKRGTTVYTGGKVTPEVGVRVEFAETSPVVDVPAADYKVEYDADFNVGTHPVKVVPSDNGNWSGAGVSLANAYDITKADLKDAKITLKEGATVPAREDLSTITKVLQYFDVKFGDVALTAADFDSAVTVTKTTTRAGQEGEFTLKAAANGNLTGTSAAVTYVAGAEKFGAKYESTYAPVYDGSAKTPIADELGELTVVGAEGKKTLAKTDYAVVAGSYKENVNVGTATATIEGVADYKGQTAEVSFKIAAKSLDGYTVSKVDGLKNGNYDEGSLLKGASVTLTKTEGGKVVDTVSLSADQVVVTVASFDRDGDSTQKYLKTVNVELKAGTNYSVSADWTADVEAQKIVATMIDLEDATVTGTIPAGLNWPGNEVNIIKKYITVTVGDTEVTNYGVEVKTGTQYALDKEVEFTINKGSSRTIQGTKAAKAKVVVRDLSDATLGATIADIAAVDYNGTEQKPEPSVALKDTDYASALVKDTDYTVAYSNNKNAGTATVTVTGKGNYTGTVTKNFTINQIDPNTSYFKALNVAAADRQFKVGAPDDLSAKLKLEKSGAIEAVAGEYAFKLDAKPVTVGSAAAKAAVESTDKVEDGININYTVTFDGTGNFKKGSTLNYSYALVKKTATDADITLENKNVEFDKNVTDNYKKAVGKVTVSVDGTELKEGTDYTTTFTASDNNVGKEGTVKVVFQGNYTSQAIAKFNIVKAVIDINNVKIVEPKASELVYDGKDKTAKFVANDVKTNLVSPEHYTLVFKNEKGEVVKEVKEAGKYTVTVKATANYGGDEGQVVSFEVTQNELSKTEFEAMAKAVTIVEDNEVEYLGEATKTPVLSNDQFEVVSYDKSWDGDDSKQGVAVIRLKSDANYKYDGTYELKYDWVAGDIAWSGLEVSDFYKIEDQVYTGSAIEPELVAINDLPVSYATVKYYENNVEIATKTAKAYVVIEIPEEENKYYGELSGVITFSIIADPEAAAQAEELAEAAAKADEEAAAAAKEAEEKAAAADKAMSEAKTDEEKAAAAKLAEEAAAAAKTADEKAAAAQAANEKAVKAAKAAYGETSAKAKAAQKKADAAAEAATKAAAASKAAETKAAEAKKAAGQETAAAKKANPMKAKAKKKVLTAKKAKNTTFKKANAFKVTKAKGKVTFKKVKGNKKIVVKKNGKVIVKKGLKKGKTYKVKVKVRAAGNSTYKAKTKIVTLKIKVK